METSKTSTGEQSSDLTLFAVDTHVSPSLQPAKDEEQTTQDTYGHGSETPLANYDQSTQSWRMSEDISLWGDYKSLENLPKSGMTRSGVLYQQLEWVRPIDETELLSWPTPTAVTRPMEGNVRMYRAKIKAGEMTEAEAEAILGKSVWEAQGKVLAMWPTPTTQEVEHPNAELTPTGRRKSKNNKTSHSLGLADAVQMWPTPVSSSSMAEDISTVQERLRNGKPYKSRLIEAVAIWPTPTASSWGNEGSQKMLDRRIESGDITEDQKRRMTAGNGGKLNPMWVEWLMGFPLGWTDLKD